MVASWLVAGGWWQAESGRYHWDQMRIALSADHAGFEMKRGLAADLGARGHEVLDLGTHSPDPVDYPDCAEAVARALAGDQADRGIIVCGSGAGVSIAVNKFPGIRAAVCHDCYTAHQAVEHDDMNVLCLGARVIGPALALDLAVVFLGASFSGEARHQRRLDKILAIEARMAREPERRTSNPNPEPEPRIRTPNRT
jgi:ribose 5-phosphate isomerase B